jgi:hypothetical protein
MVERPSEVVSEVEDLDVVGEKAREMSLKVRHAHAFA